jgi:hypothetical protein
MTVAWSVQSTGVRCGRSAKQSYQVVDESAAVADPPESGYESGWR